MSSPHPSGSARLDGGVRGRVRALARDPWALAAFLALICVLAFYAWTALTTAKSFPSEVAVDGRDYFNLLTDALLQGQAAVPVRPAPELLALDDPYDPDQNRFAFRVHDLSLYDGRYYMYWPPAPVVTLFLPGRLLLLGHDLPERAAIVIYLFVGLLIALALVRYLVRRYLPGTPRWMLAFAGLALATANVAPYLLRRPTVYEVAISAGYCFTLAAAYLILRGALEERWRWRRLLGGSVCLGLATGSRPSLAAAGALAIAALVYLLRSGQLPTWALRRRATLVLFGPASLAVVLLLVYNFLRFEDFTELGLVYQLNDLLDPYPPAGFKHVLPSLYFYLLIPAHLDLNFPFWHLPPPPDYPGTVPPGFNREPVSGLFANVPIVLLALVAVPLVLRSQVPGRRALGRLLLVAMGVGAILLLTVVVPIYSATMRYSTDFTTPFLISGLLAWMLLARMASSRRLARLIAVGGAGLILYSATLGIALSFTGEWDGLRAGRPETYARIERLASFLPTAATAIAGRPVITEVTSPAGFGLSRRWTDVAAGKIFALNVGRQGPAILKIISPDRREALLRTGIPGRPGAALGGRIDIRVRERPEVSSRLRTSGATVDARLTLERGLNHVELRAIDPPIGRGRGPRVARTTTLQEVRLADPEP